MKTTSGNDKKILKKMLKDAARNKKKKNPKLGKLLCALAIVAVVLLLASPILLVCHTIVWHMIDPITSDDIEEYISGDYGNRNGGENAAAYLPTVDELGQYEKIGYYYVNNKIKRIAGFDIPDVFYLEIQYPEEEFKERCFAAYRKYVTGSEETVRAQFEQFWEKDQTVARKLLYEQLHEDVPCDYFYIELQGNDLCVIRYAYVYACSSDDPYHTLSFWQSNPMIGEIVENE